MRNVKVIFQDGNSLVTKVNGTEQEIKEYYIGNYFNMGTVYGDMQKAISVEFLD